MKTPRHCAASVISRVAILLFILSGPLSVSAEDRKTPPPPGWENVRSVKMSGGLRAFWDVSAAPRHQAEAIKRGFDPVNLLGDYNDYPGKQERHIGRYLDKRKPANNPWHRPDYFEEIIRRNIGLVAKDSDARTDATSLFVHDIEFDFEQDIAKAWADPVVRQKGVRTYCFSLRVMIDTLEWSVTGNSPWCFGAAGWHWLKKLV